MELARTIAGNHRGAVMGVKALLMQQLGEGLETQWQAEYDYGHNIMRGAKAREHIAAGQRLEIALTFGQGRLAGTAVLLGQRGHLFT